MKNLDVTLVAKRSHGKNYRVRYYAKSPFAFYIETPELSQVYREGYDINYIKSLGGSWDNLPPFYKRDDAPLWAVLRHREEIEGVGTPEFLSRIIRAGGFISYIKQLENNK